MLLDYSLLLLSRNAVEQGEYYRLLSGHFTHLNSTHLAINLAGLALITWIHRATVWSRQGLIDSMLLALWISTLILMCNPEIQRYGGLSGILHGLFLLAVWQSRDYHPVIKGLLIAGVIAKVLAEQYGINLTQLNVGGRIAITAHLYGVLGAALLILLKKLQQIVRQH